MYESSASQDELGKERDGNKDVEIAQTVPGERHPNAPGRWYDKRRHKVAQRIQWAFFLLTVVCLVFLSACDIPSLSGASGAGSPTATPGLSGTLAAAATAQAAASASDHPSTVFIAENTGSQTSVLALNTADGSVKWRSKVFAGTMGGGVHVLQQTQGVVLVSKSDRTVMALDTQDGTERWHTGALYPSATIVVNGNTAYISGQRDSAHHGIVGAYRMTDGVLLWRYDAGDCGAEFLAAASGEVVLSPGGCPNPQVTALNEPNGAVLWQRPAKDIGAEVAIANGVVYTDEFGIVTALDAVTGVTKWRHAPSQLLGMGGSSISIGDQLVIAEAGKTLLALWPQDGSLVWGMDFPGFLSGHVITGNAVYVAADGAATVTALRLNDGVQLWQTKLDLPEPWPPIAADGVLYVSDNDGVSPSPRPGKLYAIQIADGAVAWQYTAGS